MTDNESEIKVPLFSGDDSEWLDASYQLTARETQFVKSEILGVVRQKAMIDKYIPRFPVPRGTKEYKVETVDEAEAPKFDDDFLTMDEHELRKSEATFYPVFMHYDYNVGMVNESSVANSRFHKMSLSAQTIRALTAGIMDYRDKVIWRGYDISGRADAAANNQGVIDTAVKGILNTSGINTFHAGNGDAVITTVGDGVIGASNAVVSLVADGYYGPYDIYVTPGVWGKLLSNKNATTQESDLKLIATMEDGNGNRLFKSINVTKHLLPTVEASATEANWVVIDPKDPQGGPTVAILEGFPISNIPNSPMAAVASSGKLVWSGVSGVLRPSAITWDENITYA